MATLKDIAQRAGVSISTVSKILNDVPTPIQVSDLTKQKVINIARDLRYYPNMFARSLRTNRTGIIGVVVSDIKDPFFSEIINGIERTFNENDYYFMLSSVENSLQKEEIYLSRFNKLNVDGILILGGAQRLTDNRVKNLLGCGVPIIVVGRASPHPVISSVTVENYNGGYKATECLINLGHRDIIHVTPSEKRADADERMNGYLRALNEHGLKSKSNIMKSGIDAESGYSTCMEIAEKCPEFSAIFTYNDMLALGCMRAIKDKGLRIPADVSIVGFDDIPIARVFDPPLTTIVQPREKMGVRAAELLLKLLKEDGGNGDVGENIIFPTEIVIRNTTGKKS